MRADRFEPAAVGAVAVTAARHLWPALLGLAALAASGGPARAHATDRAFVLTLPSDLYIAGGAIVVGVSFLLIALVPAANLRRFETLAWRLRSPASGLAEALSLLSFAVMVALILAGLYGTQDPLANPLPLTVWTLWWIGLTVAHVVFGDLWSALNPWRGPVALLAALPGLGRWIERPPLRYPDWLGYWPAVLFFLGFVWFELIYIVPSNPEILANVVMRYYLAHLLGVLLFGRSAWLRHGEAFSVFFRVVSWLSPIHRPAEEARGEEPAPRRLLITLPGLGLLHVPPLPASGVAFVLLALASVSFEGLAITYWWLGKIGVNPLDFQGRSTVTWPNSAGLLAVYALWMACYMAVVWLGHRLAGRPTSLAESLGSYVLSIVPIAFGYHFAHYLTGFLVDSQYAAITLNDPFGLGWNLFGLAEARVTTSFLAHYDSVRLIWHTQIAIIVIAHVIAVAIAHFIALRQTGERRAALVSQIPMTVLMIGYTLFGLWLLSTPAIG